MLLFQMIEKLDPKSKDWRFFLINKMRKDVEMEPTRNEETWQTIQLRGKTNCKKNAV